MHSIHFVHLFEKMCTTSELFMFLCFACGIVLTLHNGIRAATVQMFWCLCSFHDVLRRYYRSVVIWCQFFLCKKTSFMDSKCNFAFCIYFYKCNMAVMICLRVMHFSAQQEWYCWILCHSPFVGRWKSRDGLLSVLISLCLCKVV